MILIQDVVSVDVAVAVVDVAVVVAVVEVVLHVYPLRCSTSLQLLSRQFSRF